GDSLAGERLTKRRKQNFYPWIQSFLIRIEPSGDVRDREPLEVNHTNDGAVFVGELRECHTQRVFGADTLFIALLVQHASVGAIVRRNRRQSVGALEPSR